MLLKLITARIGDRKNQQINFLNPPCEIEGKINDNYDVPGFILEYEGGYDTELLRLYSPSSEILKGIKLNNHDFVAKESDYCPILYQTEKGEEVVYVDDIIYENGTIIFYFNRDIKPLKTKEISIDSDSTIRLMYEHNASDRYWRLQYLKNITEIEKLVIIFKLEEKYANAQQVKLFLSPDSQIRDIVLDFGSEASQIATFKRGETQTVNNIQETFTNMKSLLCDQGNQVPDEDLVQYASESKKLYKSVFYGKTDCSCKVEDLIASEKCAGSDDILEMLTSKVKAQELIKSEYIVLPNVKLSGYGGIPQPKFKGEAILEFNNYFFYRKCINNLLLSEFLNISKIERKRPICANICLLIPNVFTPKNVVTIIKNLRHDINQMIENDKELKELIGGIEFSTVSESDASLIGTLEYLNTNEYSKINSGNYLILDAGKGTLDISIIKYFGGHYICKYRSGIVGAGNALTYAYMCALAHDFLSRNKPNEVTGTDIRNFIDNIIRKDNDRFLINKMFDAVEQYKRGTKPKVKNESSNAEDIKGFTSFITNLYKGSGYQPLSEDAQEWINATINIIKEEVKNALKITTSDDIGKINYVYYTGRAFRCKNFKQSIDQFLRSEILEEDTTELNERIRKLSIENYDKILCLFIRIALYRGACSDNTFCLPFVCHQSLGVNDPWGIIEILNNLFTNRKENKDNIVSTFSSIMASPLVTSRYFIPSSTPYEYYDRGMRLGFEITFSKSDQLLYNGNYFSLDPKDKMSGKVRLFMLDGEMYVRLSNNAAHRTSEKTCIKFRDDHINLSTSPLKFGTFFPNINQEEETVIIEPRDSSNVNEDSIAAVQKESKSHHDETLNNNESYSSQFQ